MFHNTIAVTDEVLADCTTRAKRQEVVIYDLFQETKARLTPFEVQAAVLPEAPITSVRRALTNLTNSGALLKSQEQRKGDFGIANHVWQLNPCYGMVLDITDNGEGC